MSPRRMFRGKARWWTSAAAVIAVAGVLAGTVLANAAGPPLPKRTPAQLLAAMRDARVPSAMTAVITETANLGFPSLPDIAGLQSSVLSAASFISGTHTVDVWYDGPRHVRIALPVSFGETDLRVNGNQIWLWDSRGQTATHYILPPAPTPAQIKGFKAARLKVLRAHLKLRLPRCLAGFSPPRLMPRMHNSKVTAAIAKCLNSLKGSHGLRLSFQTLTPIQAADKLLAAIGPTTKVSVAGSTTVAGRSAYQLVIAPRTNQSLISQIVIAVDSATYLPLQLQVFARGTSGPAFQIGFTSLTFGVPAASNFTFTPPAGAHVKTEKLPQFMPGAMGPWAMGGLASPLPGPFTSQRFIGGLNPKRTAAFVTPRRVRVMYAKLMKQVGKGKHTWIASSVITVRAWKPSAVVPSSGALGALPGAVLSGAKLLGSGWLSVAVIPAGSGLALPAPSGKVGSRLMPSSTPGGPHPLFLSGGSAQGAQILALLRILLNSAARVHGTWGSGRLLRTSLFSILITNSGKVLVGAVTPAVLYADAAKVK